MIDRTINRATQLRKLILISSGQLDDDDNATAPQIELQIIGQLSEFFYFFQSASAIHNSLIKYCANLFEANENNKHKQIGIAASITNEDELRRIILPVNSSRISTEFSQLASCITYLNINTIEFAFEQLDNFLLCLPNLAGLTVSWPTNRPLVQLIRALHSSTKVNSNLTYLCLRIRQPPPHQFRLMFDTSPLDLSTLTTKDFQLCSITKLCLDFSSIKHTDYRLFKFDLVFPSLKTINLLNYCWTCTICAIRSRDFLLEHSIYSAKRAGCVKWITAYLRDTCPQLNAAKFACI